MADLNRGLAWDTQVENPVVVGIPISRMWIPEDNDFMGAVDVILKVPGEFSNGIQARVVVFIVGFIGGVVSDEIANDWSK